MQQEQGATQATTSRQYNLGKNTNLEHDQEHCQRLSDRLCSRLAGALAGAHGAKIALAPYLGEQLVKIEATRRVIKVRFTPRPIDEVKACASSCRQAR
jgi:hypothetical protein